MKKPKFIIETPCNPNNAFDGVGLGHNYLMSYIVENYKKQIEQVHDLYEREKLIKKITTKSMTDFYGNSIDLNILDTIYGFQGLISQIDFGKYKDIFNHIKELSEKDKKTIISYFDELTKLSLNDNLDISNAILKAKYLENEFLSKDTNITNLKVLSLFSVTRYSLSNLNLSNNNLKKISWWTVLADAVGAVVGAVVGGVLGALDGAAAVSTIYNECVQ